MDRSPALTCYALAVVVMVAGGVIAAGPFPGGFDWSYTVVSALMSRKHNPEGGMWFSAALAVSMAALWPAARYLAGSRLAAGGAAPPRFPVAALHFGLACGVLLGLERFFIFHLSDVIGKAHEVLAILTFLGLYIGVIGLYAHRIRRGVSVFWPLLVVSPLLIVGLGQLALYIDQRSLGWAGVAWREMGVPIWMSFAFWQWLAVALLWIGLGHLIATRPYAAPRERTSLTGSPA